MPKFMLSVSPLVMEQLKADATERGITVQELVRAVIIPDFYRKGELPRATFPMDTTVTKPFMTRKPLG